MAKSKAYMTEYRRSITAQKQTFTNEHGNKSTDNTTEKKRQSSTPATIKPDQISSRSEYVLYQVINGKEHYYGDRTGAKLRDLISHDDMVWKSKEKMYESRKGKKYRIRKK